MSEQPSLWHAPRPATNEELQTHKLPCDVQVGLTIFRAGTPLLALVDQHRALYGRLYEGKDYLT
jgi:hypothetical protein